MECGWRQSDISCAHLLVAVIFFDFRSIDWCLPTFLDCLTLEDGTLYLSRNAGTNCESTLRNTLEEQRRHLHRGGSLKSHTVALFFHALDP